MIISEKVAIIGGGNLGAAIAEGILKSNIIAAQNLFVTRRKIELLESLKQKGVHTLQNNFEAVKNNRIVILAVKPFQIKEILSEIKPALSEDKILISVVSGVSLQEIEEFFGESNLEIYRAMPNTSIAIQESMTCISKTKEAKSDDLVDAIFTSLGRTAWIDDSLMDAATVLGACGTAYAMRFIRANIQGGIEIGFDAKTAALIAAQTVKGAADLLLTNGSHPEEEIDKVTTPKGYTITGLNEMENRGFSAAVIGGILASHSKIK